MFPQIELLLFNVKPQNASAGEYMRFQYFASCLFFLFVIFAIITSTFAQSVHPSAENSTNTVRTIEFAGVNWYVKDGGLMGPGPNYWSDDKQSVWLDDQNRLHLKIRKIGATWYCAEVYTTEYTTYGEHRFLVEGYIDRMDKNIVLGLFVYAADNAEIDIEYAKWGSENRQNVGGYTVQPWSHEGNVHQFQSPLDTSLSTHFFDWQPNYVLFGSIQGHHYGAPPSSNDYIERWIYNGPDIPPSSRNLRTHINLWLNNGTPPTDLSVMEVIITDLVQPLSSSLEDKQNNNRKPKQPDLLQNYPNPFNPGTHLKYNLPGNGPMQLDIFNVNGQLLRTLVAGWALAGTKQVYWDGKDCRGDDLPSGIYIARITSAGFQDQIKLLRIK